MFQFPRRLRAALLPEVCPNCQSCRFILPRRQSCRFILPCRQALLLPKAAAAGASAPSKALHFHRLFLWNHPRLAADPRLLRMRQVDCFRSASPRWARPSAPRSPVGPRVLVERGAVALATLQSHLQRPCTRRCRRRRHPFHSFRACRLLRPFRRMGRHLCHRHYSASRQHPWRSIAEPGKAR